MENKFNIPDSTTEQHKIYRPKSAIAMVEFHRQWTGMDHRALVNFIGLGSFKVLNFNPLGNVLKIQKIDFDETFSASMDEVLIQKEELEQYFEEVITRPHSTDAFDQKLKDVIAFMTIREYTKASDIIDAQTKSGAAYMALMIGVDKEVPDDAKNWLRAYMYNAAYVESKV